MSVAYLNQRVELDAASGMVHADFDIRNESLETWRPGEGDAVGYHLFDADTGTLIVDGPRVSLDRELKPGESTHVHMDFALPGEDGSYQAIVSPMREGVCWYYDRGWPLLLVEGVAADGVTTIQRTRVTDKGTLRREREWRGLGRAFIYPVLTIWRNRALIRAMVRRDILGRYKGSFAGSFWTIFNPLLLMLTYFFVFGVVLGGGRSLPGSVPTSVPPGPGGFALYFLAGMLPWIAFSEAAGRAPGVILENRNFVKKLVFAVETLPVNLVVTGLVTEVFAVLLYCGFLLAIRHTIPLTVLWLPVLLIPQVLFTCGVSWFLAGLGAFVRDLGQMIGFILTVWFFTTPICYPEEQLLAKAPFMTKNPMFVLVHAYRSVLLGNGAPSFSALWKFSLLAVVVFVLGHAWFYKLRKSFADMI